jgi:hypothetical protein
MTTETRTAPRTDLPASKPPAKAAKQTRKPHKASTAGRDPFAVFGADPLGDDLDAMFGAE